MKAANVESLHAKALQLGATVKTDGKTFNAGGHVADARPQPARPRANPAPARVPGRTEDDDAALDARLIALEERLTRQLADNARVMTQALAAVLAKNADARTPIAHDISVSYNPDKSVRRMRVTPLFNKE